MNALRHAWLTEPSQLVFHAHGCPPCHDEAKRVIVIVGVAIVMHESLSPLKPWPRIHFEDSSPVAFGAG